MRRLILAAVLSAVAAPAIAAEFMLNSTEVKSGSPMSITQAFTDCKGQNISPALSWSGEPAGTQSFAVTMYDPDARAGGEWLVALAGVQYPGDYACLSGRRRRRRLKRFARGRGPGTQ
jgi:phosphatidylethanolamine-binding protein (PEBP) family uncharacterized protein